MCFSFFILSFFLLYFIDCMLRLPSLVTYRYSRLLACYYPTYSPSYRSASKLNHIPIQAVPLLPPSNQRISPTHVRFWSGDPNQMNERLFTHVCTRRLVYLQVRGYREVYKQKKSKSSSMLACLSQ
ncbi:hypothetical protein DL98DRAFT_102266 [Cadophora sp. DSE1049]|nr:hypothetical protein DL98DRAFT_102266 [Cadophora sp. DSE1049]